MVDLFDNLFDLNGDSKISNLEKALEMAIIMEEEFHDDDNEEDEDEDDD